MPQSTGVDSPITAIQIVADNINEILGNGDFVPQVEAQRLLDVMRAEHPEAHQAFLEAHEYRLYYDRLRYGMQARKRVGRHPGKRFAEGDASVFAAWHYRVDDLDTQRPAGEMTGSDWRFSARESGREQQLAGMQVAFKNAVAKKVGARRTKEVFSEDEFLALHDRILN